MEIRNSFELALPVETVWSGISDVRLVAGCLPGASVGEALPGGGYKGKLTVKLGPLVAVFNGELSIELQQAQHVAVVRDKGADAKSGTRVQANMTYAVKSAEGSGRTRVEVASDITLAGALAQFGKAGVMQEVAAHLAAEFARNFTARVTATGAMEEPLDARRPAEEQAPPRELNALALALRIIWARIKALFGFGKRGA